MVVLSALGLTGCKHSGNKLLLPNVSGKAGEIVVVMDKDNWDGDLGAATRDLLASDCPWLASKEPLFSLVNVSPTGFTDLFSVLRNILMFRFASDTTSTGMITRDNVWAQPQKYVQITASTPEEALSILQDKGARIAATFEQAERDRIIANSILYENHEIAPEVTAKVGGSPHFPEGYQLLKQTDDFMWIAYNKQYSMQGIFVMKYPAADKENFSEENIVANIDRILQEEVPGQFDNTWMVISTYIKPSVEFLRYRGRQFAQTRGFWEVHNDFMCGPFVAHSFYSKDNKDIITLFAWVYAPKYDKRQYLRQVESIAYSFEWADKTGEQAEDEASAE